MAQGERVAASGQGVHGRGDDVAVAHEAEVGIAVIVSDQQDDIGRALRRGGEGGRNDQREQRQMLQSGHG